MSDHPPIPVTLLPCPFCGGEARTSHDNWVGCTKCEAGLDLGHYISDGEATEVRKLWNTRANPTPESLLDEKGLYSELRLLNYTHSEALAKVEETKRFMKHVSAAHPSPDSVPCDTCGNPVPDRGAAKSWCSDACYGNRGEALVQRLEALRCTKEHCNAKAHSAGEHVLDKAIAIVQQHVLSATDNMQAQPGHINAGDKQREISVVDTAMLRRKARRGLFGKDGILKEQFSGISDAVEFVIDLIPTCLRKPEPVSLVACAMALCNQTGMSWNAVSSVLFKDNAKAVLDVAGVPYVD